jgi:hypothetical protein
MVGRGHSKETVLFLNVNSIHLNTLFERFLWYDLDLPSKRMFKYIQFTFKKPTVSLV